MCGIAGILTPSADGQELGRVTAMQRALRHRGPDGQGTWVSPSRQAAFAHTRLAVIDLSSAGGQPMSCQASGLTVILNGEIYNFREVRRTLEGSGVTFRSQSDTEVVLRAYEAYGSACVDHFRGMFAFAIWNERERTGWLARDGFGIKPLYYLLRNGTLTFASEVRALVASRQVPLELDPDGTYGYFRTGSVPEPHTLLRGVRALAAGATLAWADGRVTLGRHWEIPIGRPSVPPADPVAATRAALVDSVRHHLLADVPVGVFLSAGIDSTAIVALAHALGKRDLRTFSMSFPDSVADEGPDARRSAQHYGVPHDQVAIDASQAKAMLGGYLRSADQPSIDGLNTFAVSQFAHRLGMKVVLSGIGADELFGGYASFTQVPRLHAWHRRARWAGPFAFGAGRLASTALPGVRARRLGDLLTQAPSLPASYGTFRAIFTTAESARLTEVYAGQSGNGLPDVDHGAPPNLSPADGVSRLELARYVRNQLLRDADVMSMAWGLELRTPFLDREVVTVLSSIPASIRLREQKRLLREAVPELPPWVTGSQKRCFQFPFDEWLQGEWRDVFNEVERSCSVPTETWYRKWCVFALDNWMTNLKQDRDV